MALGTIIGIGKLLLDAAKMVFPDNKEINSASSIADKAGYTYNLLNDSSITQSANRALIKPIVVIDKSILHASYMNGLMQVVMARDIQAILTHFAIKNAEANGIKINDILGEVQPRRAGLVGLMGCEALTTSGPVPNKQGAPNAAEQPAVGNGDASIVIGGQSYPEPTEHTNLAIGKVVKSTAIGPTGVKIDFPLVFREIPLPASQQLLENIFSAAKVEEGFFARLDMVNSGEITYPEFFTGRDVVKEKFKIRNDDLTGYYDEMSKRERLNKAAALRSGVFSLNTMANTFIIGMDVAKQIELKVGRRFLNERSLPAIFKAIKASRIIICDEERNGVFHFIDNGDFSIETFTMKDIENKAKKAEGADTLEALTRILMGR